MSAIPEDVSELVEFPTQRPNETRLKAPAGPTIDTILRRMNPTKAKPQDVVNVSFETAPSTLEQEEADLRERQREFARVQAESMERMRAARELEILLAARERLLDDREAMLASRQAGHSPDQREVTLEKSLNETREALNQARKQLATDEDLIADLREQLACLREREAFIEQSENVLFDKAQQLQEWETRLQQREHDGMNPVG